MRFYNPFTNLRNSVTLGYNTLRNKIPIWHNDARKMYTTLNTGLNTVRGIATRANQVARIMAPEKGREIEKYYKPIDKFLSRTELMRDRLNKTHLLD
jgi:hypothetical protein